MSVADILKAKLTGAFARPAPRATTARPKRVMETTIVITATVAANSSANTLNPISITVDPSVGSVKIYKVPLNEKWTIDDIYVKSAPTTDGILILKRNQLEDVYKSPPVSAMLVSNPSRPKNLAIVYNGGEDISGFYQQLAAGGTAAETVTIYAHVIREVY